jgi:hypothetical protein
MQSQHLPLMAARSDIGLRRALVYRVERLARGHSGKLGFPRYVDRPRNARFFPPFNGLLLNGGTLNILDRATTYRV